MRMVFRLGIVVLMLALFVAACANATPAPTGAPAPTQAPAPTNAPAPTQAAAPTNAPAPTQAAAPTDAPAPTQAATEPTQASSGSSSGLPKTIAEAEGKEYAFQVIPAETTVEYAVDEILFGNKQITRGQTNAVEGDFKLGFQNGKPVLQMTRMRVDLRTLKSDSGARDNMIRRQWLESNKYPYADFVVTEIKAFPDDVTPGQEAKFQVTGDMTIREITKPVTFDVTVKLDGDKLVGTGVTKIFMKDYGFDPPEILGRFTVSDPATITITGVAQFVPAGS